MCEHKCQGAEQKRRMLRALTVCRDIISEMNRSDTSDILDEIEDISVMVENPNLYAKRMAQMEQFRKWGTE